MIEGTRIVNNLIFFFCATHVLTDPLLVLAVLCYGYETLVTLLTVTADKKLNELLQRWFTDDYEKIVIQDGASKVDLGLTAMDNCFNIDNDYCALGKKSGNCNDKHYQRICPLECGLCKTCADRTPKNPFCRENGQLCKKEGAEDIKWAWRDCRMSCYKCSLENVPKCVDLRDDCVYHQSLCKQPEKFDYVWKNCRKTCYGCNFTKLVDILQEIDYL
ncbi:shTK domain protein [Oesophagostomum dentatum]|uniref:ShTK domain protein n=1 Tax=Oesophagostomum dentatum TaxID=61180 RepID=A0A0B1TFK4_OESDE|nr:shTK domain protein [Oesophagostomum dentatum]